MEKRFSRPRMLALPIVVLFIPVLLSLVSYGEWLTMCAPVALLIGFLLRPPRLWPIGLGSILIVWVSYGFATLIHLPAVEGGGEETVWSFVIEAVIFMAVLILLPLWLGRLAARRFTGIKRHD